jgi:NADPH:quinone reductase-like Zn-dependent oxidoreductase
VVLFEVRNSDVKAIVQQRYGMSDVLHLRDVDQPVPREDQVLVKLHAASVNSWDWDQMTGSLLVRPWGLLKPGIPILGCDIAGRVEAVGLGVRRLRIGDEVFGDISAAGWGGFAEYVCVREEPLAIKPAAMSFAQVAAFPHAGVLALQGLRRLGPIREGQRILIIGAGGGVGTFAIQMAKAQGADVSAVDAPAKLPTLRAAGADHVIDYTTQDFTRLGQPYDLILDVVGRRSIRECQRALSADGSYIMLGGTPSNILLLLLLRGYIAKTSRRKVDILAHHPDAQDLAILSQLFESGKLIPHIDRCCSLETLPDAIQLLGKGAIHGKLVVSICAAG